MLYFLNIKHFPFTVQNLHTRLVKIDHVCFDYLATMSRLSGLLTITHEKCGIIEMAVGLGFAKVISQFSFYSWLGFNTL